MPPVRTVRIIKDPTSPLHYLRCAKPCSGPEWCMVGPDGREAPHCYLGGALTADGALRLAKRCGYFMAVELVK